MDKKKLIIGLLAFVLLIGGASVLYSQLSKDFAPGDIVEDETQGQVSDGQAADGGGTAGSSEAHSTYGWNGQDPLPCLQRYGGLSFPLAWNAGFPRLEALFEGARG